LLGSGIATGIGTALGAAATIIIAIGKGIVILGATIAALLSPIGLAIAGVSALVAVLLYATGAGAKAMQWLGDRFGELKDTALAAWQGIGDALATGDIALAGKILWLTLKMEWQRGVNFLESKWLDFKGVADRRTVLVAGSRLWNRRGRPHETRLRGCRVPHRF